MNEVDSFHPVVALVLVHFLANFVDEESDFLEPYGICNFYYEGAFVELDGATVFSDGGADNVGPVVLETKTLKAIRQRRLAIFKKSL